MYVVVSDNGTMVSSLMISLLPDGGTTTTPHAAGRLAAGGMSEDNYRCFSTLLQTLVLGAFSTGVFQHHCITPH